MHDVQSLRQTDEETTTRTSSRQWIRVEQKLVARIRLPVRLRALSPQT